MRHGMYECLNMNMTPLFHHMDGMFVDNIDITLTMIDITNTTTCLLKTIISCDGNLN